MSRFPYDEHNFTVSDLRRVLNLMVAGYFGGRSVDVYEAGGGSNSILDFRNIATATVTVVDISPEQIARLTYASEAVVGNIETWVRPQAFDLVVCYNVLEHVEKPVDAIDSMVACLRPGGIIVLGGPNPGSLQGLVTRLTPHWFHVLACKFMGIRNAGKPGFPPFHTLFAKGSSPRQMRRRLLERGVDIELYALHRRGHLSTVRKRSRAAYLGLAGLMRLVHAASLGAYDPSLANFFIVGVRRSAQEPDQGATSTV